MILFHISGSALDVDVSASDNLMVAAVIFIMSPMYMIESVIRLTCPVETCLFIGWFAEI